MSLMRWARATLFTGALLLALGVLPTFLFGLIAPAASPVLVTMALILLAPIGSIILVTGIILWIIALLRR